MNRNDQIVDQPDIGVKLDHARLAALLAKDGQLLLPMLDLIEHAQAAIDDLIDVMGRATIEAVLLMSAAQVAGPKQQGKKTDRDIAYHGSQAGKIALRERQFRVETPTPRRKNRPEGESREVEIPADEALRKGGRLADRMLEILIDGVSTRRDRRVPPEKAETACGSKSQVARETIEAGEHLLKVPAEHDFSGLDILAAWVDSLQLGSYPVICAVGVDTEGHKHVLGLRAGATENAEVAMALLEDQEALDDAPERADDGRGRNKADDGTCALPIIPFNENPPMEGTPLNLGEIDASRRDMADKIERRGWDSNPR